MAKLPFSDFEGSAYFWTTASGKLALKYRFPGMPKLRNKTSPYLDRKGNKRLFLRWARRFLRNGGKIDDAHLSIEEVEAREAEITTTRLGEAVERYLKDCREGNAWMAPKSKATLVTQTARLLPRFAKFVGETELLDSVTRDQIHAFAVKGGGKRETKQRRLCPISNFFDWAIKERLLFGSNPAHGIVFWREKGEEAHVGERKFYSPDELGRLLAAAEPDTFTVDAIYLLRYLACRPQDAAHLRWDHWLWEQLRVCVPRMKTKGKGVEKSFVDLHPVLVERFRDRRQDHGFCLNPSGRRTKVHWPPHEMLVERVEKTSASAVGRELGVTPNAVLKRLKRPPDQIAEVASRSRVAETVSSRIGAATKRAGLYEKGVQPAYVLRHTFASENLRAGVEPARVAAEMGISVDTVMRHYYHLVPRDELDNRVKNRWGVSPEDL